MGCGSHGKIAVCDCLFVSLDVNQFCSFTAYVAKHTLYINRRQTNDRQNFHSMMRKLINMLKPFEWCLPKNFDLNNSCKCFLTFRQRVFSKASLSKVSNRVKLKFCHAISNMKNLWRLNFDPETRINLFYHKTQGNQSKIFCKIAIFT